MKNIYCILLMFLITSSVWAQDIHCVTTTDEENIDKHFTIYNNASKHIKDVIAFKTTTLLVPVSEADTIVYNIYKSAFAKYWKFTPYKFIKPSEVQNYVGNKEYSLFLYIMQEYDTKEVVPTMSHMQGATMVSTTGGLTYGFKWGKYYYTPEYRPEVTNQENYRYAIVLADGKSGKDYSENRFIIESRVVDYFWDYSPKLDRPHSDTTAIDLKEPYATAHRYKPYFNHTLGTSIIDEQKKQITQLPELIKFFEGDIEYIYQYKEERVKKEESTKFKILCNGKQLKIMGIYFSYGDVKKILQGKTLLVSNDVVDEKSVDILSLILGIDKNRFNIVSTPTIDSIIKSKSNNYLVLNKNSNITDGYYHITFTNYAEVFNISKQLIDYSDGMYHPRYINLLGKTDLEPEERTKYQVVK